MKRRKKPKASSQVRDRYPIEQSGLYPYLVRFLEWFASRGYSPRTVQIRADGIRRFIRWADERGISRPQDVTRPILERYRRHLYHYRKDNGEPLSFATQQQRLIPLRTFFKYLARENLILSNPASELELPRVHRRLPAHILSVEEVEAVMAQTLLHGELGLRDRAMLETLYSTGIRRGELINLKLYDLDVRNGSLLVRQGKGQKDRYVPLGSRAIHWIKRYLEEVRPAIVIEPDEGYAFLHEFGEASMSKVPASRCRGCYRGPAAPQGLCSPRKYPLAVSTVLEVLRRLGGGSGRAPIHRRTVMKTQEIKPFLTEVVVAEVMQAIQSKTARLTTTYPEDLHSILEQRRSALGGMLELARALDAWRLVRALEAHKDDLSRQIEA